MRLNLLIISMLISLLSFQPAKADNVETYINQSGQVIKGLQTNDSNVVLDIGQNNQDTNVIQTQVNQDDNQ